MSFASINHFSEQLFYDGVTRFREPRPVKNILRACAQRARAFDRINEYIFIEAAEIPKSVTFANVFCSFFFGGFSNRLALLSPLQKSFTILISWSSSLVIIVAAFLAGICTGTNIHYTERAAFAYAKVAQNSFGCSRDIFARAIVG